jgi:hypothetical protein
MSVNSINLMITTFFGTSKSYGIPLNTNSFPLDSNGNVLVDIATPLPAGTNTIGNVNVANTPNVNISNPLDANGNVKVNLQTPLPAGTNTIGNVNVANTPNVNISNPLDANGNVKVNLQTPLPAGTNTIGSVNIASPLPFENAVNVNTIEATLTTANTAQALPSGIAYNFITIYNKNSNTIYVGSSSKQNIPILSGGSYSIDIHQAPINLASIYWVSSTAGDYIEVMYA